jgi:protein involved in polysaccharide export with SLBB domain
MMRHVVRKISFALLALATIVGGGCTTTALPPGAALAESGAVPDYLLGAGDRVRVTVFGEQELSGEFLVSSRGAVAMPLIGEVQAGGTTLDAFTKTVEEKLVESDMVRTPKVSTDIIAYRPFYILGEVATPGQYPYAIGMTVTKAVATAGGFTYRANTGTVFVTREGNTREQSLPVTASTWIGPGDTIRVAERTF